MIFCRTIALEILHHRKAEEGCARATRARFSLAPLSAVIGRQSLQYFYRGIATSFNYFDNHQPRLHIVPSRALFPFQPPYSIHDRTPLHLSIPA